MKQEVNKSNLKKIIERRKKLSISNENKISKVSANDPQLKNIIENFNEGKQYKK